MSNLFSNEELARYSRHIIIPEFNIEGQRRLKEGSVLVVGAGGLGSPLLLYLAAAGVGKIGIVDFDKVEDHNLQRQVLFGTSDIGQSKANAAKRRILDLNPHIEVVVYNEALTSENALRIIADYDVVADGTDNFPTRYLVNDACVILGKVNVYASIFRYDGQVSVFNYRDEDGSRGPNYRDIYPSPPPPGMVPSCAEGGVLGVLPGIIGSLQANEVIKVLSRTGEPLAGRLFIFDALYFETRILKIRKDPECLEITELIDYDQFCGVGANENNLQVNEIDVRQLNALKENADNFILIDVREPYEYEIANIGGTLIPVAEVEQNLDRIPLTGNVIVHCRSGKRSADVIRLLTGTYGYNNLVNLKGGILAWSEEIDPAVPKY